MTDPSVPLYLIFPFLDEGPNIPQLLKDIEAFAEVHPEYLVKVLAVDDGSRDGGGELLRRHRGVCSVEVIVNPSNLGPGASFARAFARLAERMGKDALVVTMEADNTSGLETLAHMLVRLKEGYEVVLASPYCYGGGFSQVSLCRAVLSHLANGLVKVLLALRGLNTFSSFFRLYRSGTIRRLQATYGPGIIDSPGFECMIELLYKLVLLEATISEVEFRLDWSVRQGKSKMKIVRTAIGYLRVFSSRRRWQKASQPRHRENTEKF